jgi:hypothetical protein
MPVRELLARISSSELVEWAAFLRLEAEDREAAAKKQANGRAHR